MEQVLCYWSGNTGTNPYHRAAKRWKWEIALLGGGVSSCPSCFAAGIIGKVTNVYLVNARPVVTAKPDALQTIPSATTLYVRCVYFSTNVKALT